MLYKWLYNRRETPSQPGRVHYQRIAVALKETLSLTGEIDQAICKRSDWP